MNLRVSISRRLAVATMLTVLSTAALAQVKNLSVRGSFDGHSLGVFQGGTLQASLGGSGNLSHLGRFTYVANATVSPANTSTGVFLLVFNNGDVIHGSFTGLGGPTGPNEAHIVENLTVNGGTGRFEGATGTLTFDRIVDVSTLPAFASDSGILTGTISKPK
jgi:hypothetical protein